MAGASGQSPEGGDIARELPGYRIERQLGRGSMGVVYLAEDIQLRRKVALKILAPTLADDELFRRRFDHESQSAANLDHPNIVPVYAAGEAGGSLYIAMRYVGGGDLRALIETNGQLSLEQTSFIITSVADALDAAHAQGMVHRDVKPANVLIDDRNGQQHYYLSDFGITKITSSGRSLTSAGQIVGTIDYIAPEQIQGKSVDGRTDLYALGCVLYQCLTGVVPFLREETAALMWAHVHDEPPPVTGRRPDLPPQIDYIVAKAMAKEPENRYATCRELALALRAAAADPAASDRNERVFPAKVIDSPPPLPVSSGMTSTYAAPTPARVRAPVNASASQRRWWWLAAGGVLALALIAGSAVAVLNYLDSRFPNAAERALLDEVPLALTLKNSCTRNADAARDTTDVQASVACTSEGDANTVVFTKFTSPKALDNHYQTAVAAAGVAQNSGDCRSAERAAGAYVSESGGTSGRALCYQQRGSSFITWTDKESQTLGEATRIDPDYAELRDWWAGVVGVKLPTPESSPTPQPPAPPPPAARAAPPAPAPVAPAPDTDAAESRAKAEEDSRRAEEDSRRDEESRRQENQPTTAPTTTPSSPTTTPSTPTTTPTTSTPTPSPDPPIKLDGPVPAAPGPQQGGPPVPGTGGCTAATRTIKIYLCTVTRTAPAYLPGTTERRGNLRPGQSPFLCQSKGSKYSVGNRTNNWWAWVGLGDAGVWAPTVFLTGGPDDGPVPGLPRCGSAPTTTTTPPTRTPTTAEAPSTTTTDRAPTTAGAPPTTTTDNTPTTTEKPLGYGR